MNKSHIVVYALEEVPKLTIEEAHKEEMKIYIKSAIDYLEMALNVVECDDRFNNSQSDRLNKIYDTATDVIRILENI